MHWWKKAPASALYAALIIVVLGLVLALYNYSTRPPGYSDLPEFDQEDIPAMKEAFFDFLRPIARHHNERIAEQRAWLEDAADKPSLGWLDRRRLRSIAEEYAVDPVETGSDEALAILLRRVDVIPESLVLIQAAKESGWGRSRFSREGNMLFGERCYEKGCGIVPDARADDLSFEVTRFPTAWHAVGSYMRNLNTHPGYAAFRQARQALRQNDQELSGIKLAAHLGRYSERGDAYIEDIISMINENDLE